MNEQIFKINGFHCDACVKVSTMKIKKISDVHDVDITSDGVATVCASRVIALDEISKSLEGLNYTAVAIK